jgi:hypothetical protein
MAIKIVSLNKYNVTLIGKSGLIMRTADKWDSTRFTSLFPALKLSHI